MNKTIFITILLYLFSFKILASEFLFKKYKPAVVKITVSYAGIPISFGTGFFVSSDGQVVTNNHVVEKGLERGYSIQVTDAENKIYSDVEIGSCLDRPIDLCYLKIKSNPSIHFKLKGAATSLDQGKKIYVIGHPQGYDFTFSDGMISGVRNLENVEQAQISAPLSPGSSGGPIFTKDGELVAVATWIRVDQGSQNLNFGATVNEVRKHYKDIKYRKLSEYQMDIPKGFSSLNEQLMSKFIKPTKEKLREYGMGSHSPQSFEQLLSGIKDEQKVFWSLRKVTFGNNTISFMLPSMYPNCTIKTVAENMPQIICNSAHTDQISLGRLEITFSPLNSLTEQEFKAQDKKNSPPIPLNIIRNLVDENKWEAFKTNLTEAQVSSLWSYSAGPTRCKFDLSISKFPILDGSHNCVENINNFAAPNMSLNYNSFYHKKWGLNISFITKTVVPELVNFFQEVSIVSQLTFNINPENGTSSARAPASTPDESYKKILSEEELKALEAYLQVFPKTEKDKEEWDDSMKLYCLEKELGSNCDSSSMWFRNKAIQSTAHNFLLEAWKTKKFSKSSFKGTPLKEIALKIMSGKEKSYYALVAPLRCVKSGEPWMSLLISENGFSKKQHDDELVKNIELVIDSLKSEGFKECKMSPFQFFAVGVINNKIDILGVTREGELRLLQDAVGPK